MEIRNKRLTDEEFFREREEVLATWPTGKDVNIDEAMSYHKRLPPRKNHVLKLRKAKEAGVILLCSLSGTAPLENNIVLCQHLQDQGHSDLLSSMVDSMTRNQLFAKAEQELKESEGTGRERLNGFPVVHYGVAGSRKLLESVDVPVSLWGPSPDMRLVDEIGLAGGHTGVIHGGAMCVLFHYNKNLAVEKCIRNFQYIYRLIGCYEENGVPILHSAQGGLSCITPPSLMLAPQIIDHLLAAEQGVKNIQYCFWGAQGSLAQAVASMITLRKLGDEYLRRFGYDDVDTSVIAGYGGNVPAPMDHSQAYVLASMPALVAVLSGSDACIVQTIDEAHNIPSKENNAASLRCGRMTLNLFKDQKIDFANSEAVKIEAAMLERETRAILERVIDLGQGDVAVGAARALRAGVLDQPFAASQHAARKVMGVRDAQGAVRYLSHGNLPFPDDIIEFHREKIAEREKAQGRQADYDTVVSDVVSISKGTLLLSPDWQEREQSRFDSQF